MQSIGRQNNLRRIAGPVAGILVLLAAVFFATSLCSAASSPGMPRIFKPRVTKLGGSLPGQTGNNDEKWSNHSSQTFGCTTFRELDQMLGGSDSGKLRATLDLVKADGTRIAMRSRGLMVTPKATTLGTFIECVRSRKKENLNAPIQEGHISAALVHLANASYRLGRALRFDRQAEQVIGDDEANNLLRDGDRGYRTPFVVPEEV